MENSSFRMWLIAATCLIGFPPDRKMVYAELEQHMQDRYDALIESGHEPEEATRMTIEAMGNARELAPQLSAIHSPFWGYCLRACRIILIILLCLSTITCCLYFSDLHFSESGIRDHDLYQSDSYGGDTGRTLLHLSRPMSSFSADGYRFTITDAVVFTEYSEYYGKEFTRLYFTVDQTGLLPRKETQQYYGLYRYSSPCHWFFAIDDLGNYYFSARERAENDLDLQTHESQTGIFTSSYQCWINDFAGDAQWVDICFDRDGHSYKMRIDLTGGVEP